MASMSEAGAYSNTHKNLQDAQEGTVASCEDVYAVKESMGRGRFSWTVFFGYIMIGEVLGAITLLILCSVGVIDPETWVSVIPLAAGAILGAIPGILLAK